VTDGPQEGDGNSLWNRLRHRKVVQWGVAYSAGSWGFLQGLSYLSTVFASPPQLQRFATVVFLAGLRSRSWLPGTTATGVTRR